MASTHNPGGNCGWVAHAPPHWLKSAYACAYDTEAIEVARAYRKKIGAKAVRGLVRTVILMQNKNISDACAEQVTLSFCKHMWTVCDIVKLAHTFKAACAAQQLITVARNLFSLGLTIHVACPVKELFEVQMQRVLLIMARDRSSESDASDQSAETRSTAESRSWAELIEDVGEAAAHLKREEWTYHPEEKEWMPRLLEADCDSDGDEEAEFMERIMYRSSGAGGPTMLMLRA